MKIYSDYAARRLVQITLDVVALALIAVGVWLGFVVSSAIAVLADIGRQIENAGAGFRGAMTDAGAALGQVPFVGDAIRAPFDSASGTGAALEDAGQTTQSVVETTAMIVGIMVAAVIVVTVAWVWLKRRIRFIRRATDANKWAQANGGADVLALRALMNGKRKDVLAVGVQPAQEWRAGNPTVIARLAQLELREAGVRIAR